MPITADFHMHSNHSADSPTPMEDMIKSAVAKGLEQICFTEHNDLDYPIYPDVDKDYFTLDVPSYKEELFSLREKYKDRIFVGFGIEIGMQSHLASDNLRIVKEDEYDFVMASQHLVDRRDPFYDGFWEPDTVKNIFIRYFEETLENIKLFPDFDVLGHLDYIARYVPEGDSTYNYEDFSEWIDPILIYLAENEKGLDLNSKALFKDPLSNPNPVPEALQRFKELGGRIITFGSDAHRPDPIACGFERMRSIAISCGFSEYYTFKNRIPTPHAL